MTRSVAVRIVQAGFAVGALLAVVFAGSGAAATQRPISFDRPVLLTPVVGQGGFEPGLVVDRFDNVWVSAHHSYAPNTPDSGSPLKTRSASFLWMSHDGKHFTNPPGATPLNEYEQYGGDEADLAVDNNGGVYFVDLSTDAFGVTSTHFTFSAWKATGPGRARLVRSTPLLPAAYAIDRPFVAAGGDGQLLITEKTSGLGVNGLEQAQSHDPAGLFVSHDGGATLTSALPYTVKGAENFCRPLIEHENAARMLAVCLFHAPGAYQDLRSVENPSLGAYVSSDGGKTWQHRAISGPLGSISDRDFLSVAQGPDQAIRVLRHQFDASGTSRLLMYTSRDHGVSWSSRDVTPLHGVWEQASISAAPNGKLGLAGYYRPTTHSPWQFRASVFDPASGSRPVSSEIEHGQVVLAPADNHAPGEFTQAAFDHESRLRVTYSVRNLPVTQADDFLDKQAPSFAVYYAQQR